MNTFFILSLLIASVPFSVQADATTKNCDVIWHEELEREGELVLRDERIVVDPVSGEPVTGLVVVRNMYSKPGIFAELVDGLGNGANFLIGPNGRLRDFGFYEEDKATGPAFRFHRNGMIQVRRNWKDDRRAGSWFTFTEGGDLTKVHAYSDGGPSEDEMKLHRSADLEVDEDGPVFRQNGDRITGVIIGPDWEAPEIVAEVVDGLFHGGRFRHRTDGTIRDIVFFEDGIRHGAFFSFHENRMIATTGRFVRGEKAGVWTHYNELGKCEKTEFYESEGAKEALNPDVRE